MAFYSILSLISSLVIFCCNSQAYDDNNIVRLPGDLKPSFYTIRIHPFFDAPDVIFDPERNETFDGEVSIDFKVLKPTSKIVLNSLNLTFPNWNENVYVFSYDDDMSPIKITNFLITPENQTITIELERELRRNEKLQIYLKYIGKIGYNANFGFYKSVSKNELTYDVDLVYATKFETTGARQVFPSFDEPNYKAIFQILIVKPKQWIALSNTFNVLNVEIDNGYEEVLFEKTPIMSTYLVAFGIGDLVSIEGYTSDNILTRIWSFRSGENRMKAALDVAIKCTDAMTKYTNYHLPLKKIDHLAVPVARSAMENFGLIIYTHSLLLPEYLWLNFQSWMPIAGTVCHEITHQWFGNMITNKWWGDIFIQEGFAQFFETKAMALAYPKEQAFMNFTVANKKMSDLTKNNDNYYRDQHHYGLHPIITKNGFFDEVTYDMGAAVIHQLEAVISEEVLQKGLQSYFQKYAFQNVNHQQLLDEIQNAVDETDLKDWCGEDFNVTKFMNLWLNQKGHPHLHIDYSNGTFFIVQHVQNGTNEKLWPLPVFVQFGNNQKRMFWSAPNYVCKNGSHLPKVLKIKNPVVFVNRDALGVAETYYSASAIQVIADALTSMTSDLQLSPASLYAFLQNVFDSTKRNEITEDHLKNIVENIFMHQRNVFTFGIFEEFSKVIKDWLANGRFDGAFET